MSYIECKSFVTGKENVQYGLIDVELTHNKHNTSISFNNTSDSTYFNTAPDSFGTQTVKEDSSTSKGWSYQTIVSKGITGRQVQNYSASGVLNSNYTYVHRGKFPIISKQIININNLKEGLNVFNLFETTNNKVILEVLKLKNSVFSTYNDSFTDLDGKVINDPYVIAAVRVVQIFKSNGKVISEIEMLDLTGQGRTIPIEFTLDTAIFRIKNFNPAYATNSYYSTRFGMWFDITSGSGNRMYIEGGMSENEGDFVGMEFSILSTEYWRSNVVSGNGFFNRYKIVNSDNSEIKDSDKENLNTRAHQAWILNEIDANPGTFMTFSKANGYTLRKIDTNEEIYTYSESYMNSDNKYKTISHAGDSEDIYINKNMAITPIIAPYVDSNYNPSTGKNNGIYIPLTSTVFEGDPEEPDDPVDPDEPETTIPADDPGTDYTPSLPGDLTPGFVEWPYPNNEVISGIPGDFNLVRPGYSNFIFRRMNKTSDTDDSKEIARVFIDDCVNVSASENFQAAMKLVKGHPTLNELVTRVYQLPLDYDAVFPDSAGIKSSTITYGFVGPVTMKFDGDAPNSNKLIHYYNRLVNRFVTINLGTMTVEKVFNNYLDYVSEYTVYLPFGAGTVNIDPNKLFDVGRVNAKIDLTGILDFDVGSLTIVVQVNRQIYYETTISIAVDTVINAGNGGFEIAKAVGRITAGLTAAVLGAQEGLQGTKGINAPSVEYRTNDAGQTYLTNIPSELIRQYNKIEQAAQKVSNFREKLKDLVHSERR